MSGSKCRHLFQTFRPKVILILTINYNNDRSINLRINGNVCCSKTSNDETRTVKEAQETKFDVAGMRHTCQPRETFSRDKRRALEGGPGGPPPEIKKNLHCKWCNLGYS